MGKCKYNLAWRGVCGEETVLHDYCSKHLGIECSSCGAQATHQCSETMGLVCGSPLCNDCEHTIHSNGCNSGGNVPEGLGMHCKKEDQVFKPWYVKESTN